MTWRVFNPDLEIDHQRIPTTEGLTARGAIIRAAASRRLWSRDFYDLRAAPPQDSLPPPRRGTRISVGDFDSVASAFQPGKNPGNAPGRYWFMAPA